jgi:hypothetical protein
MKSNLVEPIRTHPSNPSRQAFSDTRRASKDILITRMITVGQFAYLCSPPGAISLWNINTGGILNSVRLDQFGPYDYSSDSRPLSITVAGDTVLLLQVTQQPECGLFQSRNNVSVSIE